MPILLSVSAALVVWGFSFRFFFGGLAGFLTALRYTLTPDLISIFRGEFEQDWGESMRFGVWLALGALAGFATYMRMT